MNYEPGQLVLVDKDEIGFWQPAKYIRKYITSSNFNLTIHFVSITIEGNIEDQIGLTKDSLIKPYHLEVINPPRKAESRFEDLIDE